MIGIGTALADDPLLTCRLPGMEKYSPVRIVADGMLRLPLTSRLVQSARDVPVWLLAGAGAPQDAEFGLLASGVEVLRLPESSDPLNLQDALEFLAAKGITRLMVEGGPALAAAFLAADLVDEAILFHSAKVVGADGVDALDGDAMTELRQRLNGVGSEAVGSDRQETFERK